MNEKIRIVRNREGMHEYSGKSLSDEWKDSVMNGIPEYWVTNENGETLGTNLCPVVRMDDGTIV